MNPGGRMIFDTEKERLVDAAKIHPLYQVLLRNNGRIVVERGSKTPDLLFCGEAPGFTEIQQGIPFCGRSGQLLNKWVQDIGIANYAVLNAVPLIPLDENGRIRPPTKEEIEYFRPFVRRLIDALKPKYIVCVGKSAASCHQQDFKLCSWKDNFGFIYHPSYYLRNGKDGLDDFKKLIDNLGGNIEYLPKKSEELAPPLLKKVQKGLDDF